MAEIIRFSHWCSEERYNGYRPPRRDYSWEDKVFVYLLNAGGFAKIGVANDVARRVAEMQSGCPFPLTVVSARTAPLVIAFQVERRVHSRLQDRRVHGEWFRDLPNAEAKDVINKEIIRAKQAMTRWVRDGYHQWAPPLSRTERYLAAQRSQASGDPEGSA